MSGYYTAIGSVMDIYVFVSFLLPLATSFCIRFCIRFDAKGGRQWDIRAQSTRSCGSATPMTTAATAPPRRAPTNSPPPRRGCSACGAALWPSSDGAPRYAVENREEYGVWAGVKLPGGQYRKREQLAERTPRLRRIAAGEISSRQLAENAALLTRRENDAGAGDRDGVPPARWPRSDHVRRPDISPTYAPAIVIRRTG